MKKPAIDKMDNPKMKALYTRMWGNAEFDFEIDNTPPSKNSFCISGDGSVCERLIAAFDPRDPKRFEDKFKVSYATNGKESNRIAVLLSSALCALLFFYNVSPGNRCTLNIDGEDYVFEYSCFEYQNPVVNGGQSNVDVVLVGKHQETNAPVILFLESKFSEYYRDAKIETARTVARRKNDEGGISDAYLKHKLWKELFDDETLKKMELSKTFKGKKFFLCSDTPCYTEGIKQMICHYIGVRNFYEKHYENKEKAEDTKIAEAVAAGAKILLGAILFTNGIGQLRLKQNGVTCLDSYTAKYGTLSGILNDQLAKGGLTDKIRVIKTPLSYDQLEGAIKEKEPRIHKFYFEQGKKECPDT